MSNTREDSADYAQLFLADVPLIDTRAPIEFTKGSFPNASNLPLMSDEERAAVGTCYKQQGQDAAIKLGHELVSGSIKEQRVAAWREFAQANPEGYLYCFRGGMRSQIAQQWLREAGVDYPRISGGYKAMRRFLIDTLEERCQKDQFWLVAGATGCGKTRALSLLPRTIDLEHLARHRGSAFGRLLEPQPTQIDYENAIAIELLRLASSTTDAPVLLEDEGRLVGRLAVPEPLRKQMMESPLLVLNYSIDERVEVVLEDYILDLGRRFKAAFPDTGPEEHRARLLGDLDRTRKRLGGERYRDIKQAIEDAFDAQWKSGDLDLHRHWIERLLTEYYDPMYRYQLSQREGRKMFEGSREDLAEFVSESVAAYAN